MLPGSVPIDVSQPERARAVFTPKAIVQSQATPNRSSPAPLTILDPSGDMISVTASGLLQSSRSSNPWFQALRAEIEISKMLSALHAPPRKALQARTAFIRVASPLTTSKAMH